LKGKVLKDIKDYYSAIGLSGLILTSLLEDNSLAIKLFTILNRYSYAIYKYLIVI
ncbi:uncharacterized protein BKA55DRAFT_531011, partial [Fusarium redolens]